MACTTEIRLNTGEMLPGVFTISAAVRFIARISSSILPLAADIAELISFCISDNVARHRYTMMSSNYFYRMNYLYDLGMEIVFIDACWRVYYCACRTFRTMHSISPASASKDTILYESTNDKVCSNTPFRGCFFLS